MTVLGKSMFCNHQGNISFRQQAPTDVKTTGWKIIGEQDNHMVSEYYPIYYFLITKENLTVKEFRKLETTNLIRWLNWILPNMGHHMPPGTIQVPIITHAVFMHTYTNLIWT